MITVRTSFPPPREKVFLPHSHPEPEIGYFPHGRGVYTLADRSYEIEPGDVFLFGANELHKVTSVSAETPMETVCIRFQIRALFDPTVFDDGQALLSVFARTGAYSHKLDRTSEIYPTVVALIEKIRAEAAADRPFSARMIKSALVELLVLLDRECMTSDAAVASTSPDRTLSAVYAVISAAVDEMDNHFDEDITVASLAAKSAMSVNFFTDCFKKLCGVTPKRYLTAKRVDHAIKLIKTTELTMLDIATRCGFNSSAGFNKAFRKLTGRTPMMYREKKE